MDKRRHLLFRTVLNRDLSNFDAEIRVRQVVDLTKQTPIHAIANLGNGTVLAWVFWGRLPHWAILTWLGSFALFSALMLYGWNRKRGWPLPDRVSQRAILKMSAWSLCAGLLWATAVIYAFSPDSLPLQLLLLFLVGGLGAGAVASMAPQPIATVFFFGPPVISMLALLAIQGGRIAHAMAMMGVLYVALLFSALFSGFSSFVEIVRSKIDARSLETRLLEIELAESTKSNRAKSQFLANMSHELRTPLNAVIGFSEIIRDQALGTDAIAQYRDYANDIHLAGEHLLRIVNDVLDISKIEAGRLELHEGEMNLSRVIDSAVRLVSQAAADAGIVMSVSLPVDLPNIVGDEFRIKQVLLNLLSNAVKFSDPSGRIEVGARSLADGRVSLWVSDTGIGMTEAEIAAALEPFHQAESSYARNHDGTGLGLSLVDGFVRLHGGQLEISSTPAVGTTVTATFPQWRVLPRPESLHSVEQPVASP